MPRLKSTLAYDGTNFSGWQVQPSGRTVQGVIEAALKRMHKGCEVRITGSGRTDAGVHARGQVFHFDSELDIPAEGWRKALNSLLPDDIQILKVEPVSREFHARFDVRKKEYRYRILRSEQPDVFRRHYTYHFPHALDQSRMEKAAEQLVGEHDFSTFCAANTDVKTKIRCLETLEVIKQHDELVFRLAGNGFLYQMVRIIVGTLIEVGSGKRSPENVSQILAAKERTLAGPTAPGCGLTLWEVTYDS
ncbi:MAG TPA: tRNA pseudouridine(38-40) synthase TruA [Bacillales bacterium]|nr:tRNA pseudouridine(38-40) synthase TruA [Bacillales bacterium]